MSEIVSPEFRRLYDSRSHAFAWVRAGVSLIKAVNALVSMYGSNSAIVIGLLRQLTVIAPAPTEAAAGGAAWSAGFGAIAWPVIVGAAAIVGEGVALGAGYYAAGEKIADEACKSGYAHGIVLGAMREGWPLVQQFAIRRPHFWNYQFFPAGAVIEAKHYDMAMALGYSDGAALLKSQSQELWSRMAAAGGKIAGGGPRGDIRSPEAGSEFPACSREVPSGTLFCAASGPVRHDMLRRNSGMSPEF